MLEKPLDCQEGYKEQRIALFFITVFLQGNSKLNRKIYSSETFLTKLS